MTKRTRKYQVTKLMDEVSKMQGSPIQYHDLRKVWNSWRERYSWQVSFYNDRGQYRHSYIGDTLTECMDYLLEAEQDSKWREDQKAKWEAEAS